MSIPELYDSELEKVEYLFINVYNNMLIFLDISTLFFNNMYGNIYEDEE